MGNNKKYVIGIDNGGTFIKAAIFDERGSQICIAKEPSVVTLAKDGIVEIDQEELWEANCRCVSNLIAKSKIDPELIKCIGIAGQGKGLYIVGHHGENLRNAITSADSRSRNYVEKWQKDGTADKIFPYTYQGLYTSHPVSLLAWLKDHEPENYKKMKWVFSMKDFLVYRMTGVPVADYCNQSGGSFMNLNTGKYEPKILEILGIPEIVDKLPPIMNSTEICGHVTKEASGKLGCNEGTKVIVGMFDVDASSIGMGIVSESEFGIITGTCSINAYVAKDPIKNRSVLMNSYYCIPDFYFIEEGSNTSAGVLEWVIDILYKTEKNFNDMDKDKLYSMIDESVKNISPEQNDVLFLPFLYGSAQNNRSRGVWLGMTPISTREDMIQAVYEGVVFSHKWHINRLLKNRAEPLAIRMAGGAKNSNVWSQMFADILQIPVQILSGQELGVTGVAMAASVGVGIYKDFFEAATKGVEINRTIQPNRQLSDIYSKKYERYIKATEQLNGLWDLY